MWHTKFMTTPNPLLSDEAMDELAPNVQTQLNIRIDKYLRESLSALAKARYTSLSALVREAILLLLETDPKGAPPDRFLSQAPVPAGGVSAGINPDEGNLVEWTD